MDILKLRGTSLFVVALMNFVLAIVLWYNSKKDKAKLWMGFLALFSCFYVFFCGATYFFWGINTETSLFWYKTTWIGIFILPCFVIFSYYFVNNTKYLFLKGAIMYIAAFIIIYFVFTTDLFVRYLKLENNTISSINGNLDIVGRIYILVCILISLYNLVKEYLHSIGFRKTQLRYFIFGACTFLVSGSIATSIIPLIIKESPYYDIVAYVSFIWVALTSYAILRYKLMDIKVITTQLFVFALWVILLLKVFSANGLVETVINLIILLFVVSFGVLLIRGVLREVEQREEISRMAEDVKRAYVIEKKSKEELEKLDKVKDQFLMQVQHDLRTPLTSVMGYIDLLLNGTFGKHTKKTGEILKKLQGLTTGMIRKANNFLDLAQFQLGKSPVFLRSGIELVAMLEEIKNELDFKAQSKGICLSFEKPPSEIFISADQEKLKAALFNIADNSVKYTIKGGVTVSVNTKSEILNSKQIQKQPSGVPAGPAKSKIQNLPQLVRIVVKDTGIGIPPDKVKTIFETMFSRTSGAEKTAMGIGVGLYLSTQIIKAHNGRVWAESQGEGKGSTFYIELPIGNEVNKNNESGAVEATKAA